MTPSRSVGHPDRADRAAPCACPRLNSSPVFTVGRMPVYLLTWLLAGSVGIASAASIDPPSAAQRAEEPSASNARAAASDVAAPLTPDQPDPAAPEDRESTQSKLPVVVSANEDSAGPEAPQRCAEDFYGRGMGQA